MKMNYRRLFVSPRALLKIERAGEMVELMLPKHREEKLQLELLTWARPGVNSRELHALIDQVWLATQGGSFYTPDPRPAWLLSPFSKMVLRSFAVDNGSKAGGDGQGGIEEMANVVEPDI